MKAPVKIRIKEQRGIDYEKKSHFQYYVLCYYSIIDPDQRIENQVKEQQLLTKVKQYLNENGCCNSGVTLTYVTDESGACDYTFTIHHKRINDMSEEEREAFSAELMQACDASGSYSISYEYLLTDF